MCIAQECGGIGVTGHLHDLNIGHGSHEEATDNRERIQTMQRQRDAETEQRQQQAAKDAARRWMNATLTPA